MIKVKYQYPWGPRDVEYSEWQLVRENSDETKDIIKCHTQSEYDRMKLIWFDLKAEYCDYKTFKEFNTNYFEVGVGKDRTICCYIIGFLA